MDVLLVGAGGHAKAVLEAMNETNLVVNAYVDPKPSPWLENITHYSSDDAGEKMDAGTIVLGIGGVEPQGLSRRLDIYRRYRTKEFAAPQVVHFGALVSQTARLGDGCIVLARAVVQPSAIVGEAAIVNTGAIVEHDSNVGNGAHIAPGAIVLGGATIGSCAMIGAGAVVLPGVEVPDRTLVPAQGRFPQ